MSTILAALKAYITDLNSYSSPDILYLYQVCTTEAEMNVLVKRTHINESEKLTEGA